MAGVTRSQPLSASIFVADHLRSEAKKTGVYIEDGQRFGLHNLRHSLSNWLVNKARVEPKTVQGILRHAKIQTTLDLYTRDDGDGHGRATTAYSALGAAVHGLMTVMPAARKGASSRVATLKRREAAMAAIWASATAIE